MHIFKLLGDTAEAVACEEAFIYKSYGFRFFGIDFGFAVSSFPVAEEVLVVERHVTFLCAPCLAPFHVGADILGFALCDASVDSDIKLCAGLVSVDTLFLEVHHHAQVVEHSDKLEAVNSVSCEAGDGLDDDHIDLALLASADHSVELITLFVARSGDTLVGVDAFEYPSRLSVDAVGVVLDLRFVAMELFLLLGGHSAVIPYIRSSPTAQLLPSEIYAKFRNNYSRDEAIVIYSSGTTGKSKGIILSHFAINTNADAIINYMKPCNNDCMYIVKNLTHSSSITGELLVDLKMKIDLLITPTIVPPRYTLMNIEKYGVTILCINPTLLKLYVDDIKKNNKKYDLSALKKIYVNGAKADKKLILGAQNTLINQQIYYEYGLSEAGPRVASQALEYCNIHSVGKPIMGVQVKILKENGETAAINEHGIIHVLTPSKYEKYILGEVKYSSLYKDWLNTGDIGYIDENEELHVLKQVEQQSFED